MAQSAKNTRIAAGFGEIKKFIDSGSYSKIIKAANKILNDDNNQREAWKCKIVAYIQCDQFKEASSTILKAPNKKDLQFELAYCQYRLNNVTSALETLTASSELNTAKGKELHAQILYRLEQYDKCHSVYKDLLRTTEDDMDMERTTNMAAVQVFRTLYGQCEIPAAPAPDAPYEQWYNSGCAAVAGNKLQEGATRLEKSLKKCATLLEEEGAAEEEIAQEQAIIRVQQGYALQLQGKEKEAIGIYNSVQQIKLSDPALIAILHNNIAATSARDPSVFDVRKKMKSSLGAELIHKLTSVQKDQLTLNNAILAYLSQQPLQEEASVIQECNKLLQPTSTCLPGVKLRTLLVLAASLAKSGKIEDAVTQLHNWVKSSPQDARIVTLAATQLRLMKSDVASAISELSSLPPADRYRPGVVSALVTLLNNRKQKVEVTQLLDQAVKWHSSNKGSNRSALENLLRRASDLQMREGNPEGAAAALEQLRITNPESNDACVASLIHAYSQFNEQKAIELSRTLPDVSSDNIDADALEASLGPKYFLKAAQKQQEDDKAAIETAKAGGRVKPRKKKKRKTVLPKSYVAGVAPDPERWLPRWQRKSGGTRRRRDKKKEKDVGRGTQGGTGDAADRFDITKNPGQYKSSAVHQQPEPQGPRRNMPKKKTNKKK